MTWQTQRFRALEPERTYTIATVAGGARLACAALDGPLRCGFEVIGRYRTAERMLTRELAQRTGKPGASSAPVGRRLNDAANICARLILRHTDLAPATHQVRIDDRTLVEAFPSSFMGVMIEEPWSLNVRRHNRSDRFFVHCAERGVLTRLVDRLLPGRHFDDPSTITNHDERAALVCALTALCVAADAYTAVGDDDGWIILPPFALIQPWARAALEANAQQLSTAHLPLFRSEAA